MISADEMIERAESWTFQEDTHYNGGKEWFGRGLTCVQEPRLTVFVRYDKKLKTSTQTWRVDGIDHTSFYAAMGRLSLDEKQLHEHNKVIKGIE